MCSNNHGAHPEVIDRLLQIFTKFYEGSHFYKLSDLTFQGRTMRGRIVHHLNIDVKPYNYMFLFRVQCHAVATWP